jgi:hypothetical protein
MRITYVGGDAGIGDSVVGITTDPVTWPTVQPGDFALLSWVVLNTSTVTDPSGFSVIDNQTQSNQTNRIYGRVCDGSESGNITLTSNAAQRHSAAMAIWRGAHKLSPVQAGDFVRTSGTVSATTHAPGGQAIPVSDCAVATIVSERASSASTAYTPPSGYTLRQSGGLTGNGSTIVAIADDGLATDRGSGTTVTPGVWTGTQSASGNWQIWTVALRPREYEGWGVDL